MAFLIDITIHFECSFVCRVENFINSVFDDNGTITIPDNGHLTHTISYDEKPGIQAVANKYPDYNPTEEKTAISVRIMSMCGLELCHCLQVLIS